MGPRAGLDGCRKSCPHQDLILDRPAHSVQKINNSFKMQHVSRGKMKSEDIQNVQSHWTFTEVTRKKDIVDLCGPVKGCNAELYPHREPSSIDSWGEEGLP